MKYQPILRAEHKSFLDQSTHVRVSRIVAKPADSPAPESHPVITKRQSKDSEWPYNGDGMEPDNLPDMGMPQANQPSSTISFSPVGLTRELPQDAQPESAFDSVRHEMHAQYLKCLAANRRSQLNSLLTAIAAAIGQCPCCGSNEVCTQGPPVTVVWVGLGYRLELLVPICYCIQCQHTFSVRPLQVSCMPANSCP